MNDSDKDGLTEDATNDSGEEGPAKPRVERPDDVADHESLAKELECYGDRRVLAELRTGVSMEVWPADDGDEFTYERMGMSLTFVPGTTAVVSGSTKLVGSGRTLALLLSTLSEGTDESVGHQRPGRE